MSFIVVMAELIPKEDMEIKVLSAEEVNLYE